MAENPASSNNTRKSTRGRNSKLLPANCKRITELLELKKPTTKFKATKEDDDKSQQTEQTEVETCTKNLDKLQFSAKEPRYTKSTEKRQKNMLVEVQKKKQQKKVVEGKENTKDGPVQVSKKKRLEQLLKVPREEEVHENGRANVKEKRVKVRTSSTDTDTMDEGIEQKNVRKGQKSSKGVRERDTFPTHIPVKEMKKILQDPPEDSLQYIEGYLRINPRFYKHAYLSMPDQQSDLLIIGLRNRNRAFNGDLVAAKINPPEKWQTLPGGCKQKTGTVVCILEKIHPRKAIGYLKQHGESAIFHPRDQRIPLLMVYPDSLPSSFATQPEQFKNSLFLVNIVKWKKPQLAVGHIERLIGETGDLQAESRAILLENDLDVTPYTEEMTEELPPADYVPTEVDMKDREDWRNECVFTIDPATAVDLDDAVSCKPLENGNYEIGVHISDVTHYLKFLSPLDVQVAERATTVYMTDSVYHMLPKQLCQVCSLLPGQEKLAFSVIWEMTPTAQVVKRRFAKTVIKSCCQMSYQHAQMFIENPTADWSDDFVDVKENFTVRQLSEVVNNLHKLAVQMRNSRFSNGALKLSLPKLYVIIDKETGLPTSYTLTEQEDSNRLIEEFMLLANMTVARHLFETIPNSALLRHHKKPSKNVLSNIKGTLQKFGVHLDIETAGTLQASISRYELEAENVSEEVKIITKYRMMVINNLCSKAMTRALYKCSSNILSEDELWHYALNVPLYTHFTSPIRRYVDCVVHRLLYSTCQNEPLPKKWCSKLCARIAANCNVKKYSSKLAQEQSSELYFTYLINVTGPLIYLAIVLHVNEQSVDVILCDVGLKLRIYFVDMKDVATVQYSVESAVPTITVSWKHPVATQVINIFTLLHVEVNKHKELFRLTGTLLPPQRTALRKS